MYKLQHTIRDTSLTNQQSEAMSVNMTNRCDFVWQAAQMAAAAAASGITLGKELTVLDGATRNMNGTNISTPFTNLGPNDSSGVGQTPRVSVD